ncbi:FACT complex subunit like [Actinidia chinensis var. chinensis]|uniref:FACT complex subunit like n=1 Tax=Actinidia chinensis var. chinensis TaxID=1590841 RepID=A0A2R6QG17_ACTCC|nr:FACT complex subunit like [Actinidia chinensis var. chinensis]
MKRKREDEFQCETVEEVKQRSTDKCGGDGVAWFRGYESPKIPDEDWLTTTTAMKLNRGTRVWLQTRFIRRLCCLRAMRNGVGPILVITAMNWMTNSYFLLGQKRERRLTVKIFLVFPKEHPTVKKALILQVPSLQAAACSLDDSDTSIQVQQTQCSSAIILLSFLPVVNSIIFFV